MCEVNMRLLIYLKLRTVCMLQHTRLAVSLFPPPFVTHFICHTLQTHCNHTTRCTHTHTDTHAHTHAHKRTRCHQTATVWPSKKYKHFFLACTTHSDSP